MLFAAPLLTLLILAQGSSSATSAFRADEMLAPPGGPEVAIFRSGSASVISLRLSIPLREEGAEAGAGQIIQIQAEARMRSLADRIGARAEVHRTPHGLVYQISGPVGDLDFLAWIMREGLQPPSTSEFEGTRRRIRVANERRLETPQGVLASRVRAALAPGTPSVYGTPGSLDRIDPVRLTAIWDRSHRREHAKLVVTGGAPTELILALVADLTIPDGSDRESLAPGEDTGSPATNPEVIRHWVVEAYPVLGGDEASAILAARWLAENARRNGEDFEVGVEVWDVGGGRALIVTGAAFPRSRQTMEARLATLFDDAMAQITEDDVDRLSGQLRTEIIMAGRTPWGLAELVGQAWDAGSGVEGVDSLLSQLDELNRPGVIGLVEALSRGTPVREELRP